MRRLLVLCAAALLCAACATTPELPPGVTPLQAAYADGLDKLGAGDAEAAIEAFEVVLEEEPRNWEALRGRVDAHRRLGRLPALLTELEELVKEQPDEPALHYALGLARFASGARQLEPALSAFRRAIELAPAEAELHARLGVALLEAERFEEAKGPLEKAVALQPGRARAWLPLGLCRARLGDRPGALQAFRELLAQDPSPRDVQLAARAVARLHDPFRGFPAALQPDLEQAILWIERADAPRQALDKLDPMLADFPDLAVLHRLAGLCHERLDDAGRALEAFRRAQELAPDDPMPYQHVGDLYHSKEKLPQAREAYVAVLERDPFNPVARRRLGDYALAAGDAPAAVTNLQVCVWLSPESGPERVALARALTLSGELSRATAELSWVVDREPKNLDARMQLGATLLERRDRSKDAAERGRLAARAAEAFEAVLDEQPENAAAARLLARARE